MNTPHPPTQRDVARAVGCDVSTVSLALRNDPRLRSKTKKRIEAAAKRLGYQPNPLVAAAMASTRRRDPRYRGTLGYIRTLPLDAALLQSTVYSNFLLGARQRAASLGYSVEVFSLAEPGITPGRLLGIVRARRIVGLLLEHVMSSQFSNRRLPMDVTDFPAASFGMPLVSPKLNFAANDQYMRPILAARELLQLGYRKLGLIIDPLHELNFSHRVSAGMWAAQFFGGIRPTIPTLLASTGETAPIRAWMRRHRPDAVLSTNYSTLPFIRSLGYHIPDDLGWVHLDWTPEFKPAAGVYGNSEHTGAAAVDLVIAQIHSGEQGPPAHQKNIFVAGVWVPGNTVRRIAAEPVDFDRKFFETPQSS